MLGKCGLGSQSRQRFQLNFTLVERNIGWALLIAVILLPYSVNAQRKSQFGVKAGMNAAMFGGGFHSETSPKFGYHAGVYYRWALGDLVTLRPELFYSLEGQVFDSMSMGRNGYTILGVESTTSIHKLSIPVIVEWGRKITVDLGAQLGLLLSADNTLSEPPSAPFFAQRQDISEYLEWGDFSVIGGIGFHHGRHFDACIRYNYGLSRLFESRAYPSLPTRQSDFKSVVLQASVGYSF
jgi:hypothetical protein